MFCKHGIRRERCKECAWGEICEHGIIKYVCKLCGGRGICQHAKRKSECKECGGANRCSHDKLRHLCRECGGGSICPHGIRRTMCKICGGGSICHHGILRTRCKDCRKLRDAISEIHDNNDRFFLPQGHGDGHSEADDLPGLEGLQRSAAAAVGPASAAVELNSGFRVGDDGFIEENSFEKNLFADYDPDELSGGKHKRRYTKRQRNNRRRTKKNKKMTKRKTNKKKYI